jgi:hypothetical protein
MTGAYFDVISAWHSSSFFEWRTSYSNHVEPPAPRLLVGAAANAD